MQAARSEFSRNVGDMLRLHEDLLLQIKKRLQNPMAHSESRFIRSKTFKHSRRHTSDSHDDLCSSTPGEKVIATARPFKDVSLFLRFNKHRTGTTPDEAADVARLFEHMVCDFQRT